MRSVNTVHPSKQHPSRRRAARSVGGRPGLGLLAAPCGSDDDASDTTDATDETTAGTEAPVDTRTRPARRTRQPAPMCRPAPTHRPAPAAEGEPLLASVDPERCAANQEAGTITYLSSFDFAAAASIVDVVVAEQSGYFDDLCLDVELLPSFSTANYPLVAQQRGAVLVRRQLHRDPQQHRRRRRVRGVHRLRQDADRSADHPGRWRHRTGRARRRHHRRQG